MKRIIAFVSLALFVLPLSAKGTPFAAGFGLSDSAGNFGLNLELSSPTFARDFLIVRAESQLDFLSLPGVSSDAAWSKFSSHRLGLAGNGGWNSETIRLYGEFGGLMVLPDSSFSEKTAQWGIYGLFGFEFFVIDDKNPVAYYLEAGSTGLFGGADKLPDDPSYYSGFCTKTGLRFYF